MTSSNHLEIRSRNYLTIEINHLPGVMLLLVLMKKVKLKGKEEIRFQENVNGTVNEMKT